MPEKFEWVADEEDEWANSGSPDQPPHTSKRWKRLIFGVGIVMLVLVPTAFLSLLFFRGQILQTTTMVEDEVGSTHLVLLEALIQDDIDLIETLISDSEPGNRESFLDQISSKLLVDRKSLGLRADYDIRDLTSGLNITVTLSPDFTYAEVATLLPYRSTFLKGPNDRFKLVSTLSYQREGDRWAATVLDEESGSWGEWVELAEGSLIITTPEADAEIAQKLMRPMSKLVEDVCRTSKVVCPSDLQIELHFNRQQNRILRLSDAYPYVNLFPFRDRYFFELPAPTIIGRPVDSLGQEALFKGYASWLATSMVARFSEVPDDEIDKLATAVLQDQGLDFPPRPLAAMPRVPTDLGNAEGYLPTEDLLLLCSTRYDTNLFRLDFDSGLWSDEWSDLTLPVGAFPTNHTVYVTAAPDHHGALIHLTSFSEGQPLWQSYWWRNDDILLLIDDDEPYDVYPPTMQRDINRIGRFIRIVRDDQSGQIEKLTTSWFDLVECLAGPCEIQNTQGFPIWSPEGKQTLAIMINGDGQLSLFRGDRKGLPIEYLGYGSSPFWIDESTFGYVRPAQITLDGHVVEDAGNEIVVASIMDDPEMSSVVNQIIHTKFLREALPPGIEPGPLQIVSVLPFPRNPHRWAITAAASQNPSNAHSFLFEFDINDQKAKFIFDFEEENLSMPILQSPNGGYLALTSLLENEVILYVRDFATGRMTKSEHNYPIDWTNDDRWMLFYEGRNVVLFSPEIDVQIDIPIDINGCSSAIFTSEVP